MVHMYEDMKYRLKCELFLSVRDTGAAGGWMGDI